MGARDWVEGGADRTGEFESILGEGRDMGRIVALSDGVFAFAMTLLVVNLLLPTSASTSGTAGLPGYLGQELPALFDYALAFLIIAAWWSTHHRIFSAIRSYDLVLMRLNNLFLLLISVTPFLLAIVFAYGPRSFFDLGLSSKVAVAIFSAVQVATGAVVMLIWRHASVGRRLVDADLPADLVAFVDRQAIARMAVMIIALAVALVIPLLGEVAWAGALVNRWAIRPPALPPSGRPIGSSPPRL
jgi:uncharacterized membrane protein